MLKVENLSFKYPKTKERVLKSISLSIKKGELLAILGPSGAGRSTFCLALNGIIPEYEEGEMEGKVKVFGKDTRKTPIPKLVSNIGLVFQNPETQIFENTVSSDVAFGPCNFNLGKKEAKKRVNKALKKTRLPPDKLGNREVTKLSGGQKQRLSIAGALALKPKALILDEPTAEIDPVGRREVFNVIKDLKELEKTMVIVSHDIENVASFSDRIVLFKNGKIIDKGKPKKILKKEKELKRIGVRVPQVTKLFLKLRKEGFRELKIPITLKEAEKQLRKILEKEGKAEKGGKREREKEKGRKIVEVKNLHHTYEPDIKALRGVNLEVRKGEFLAIIGENGSGKSTLVKHFNGLLKPTKGKVCVKGKDVEEKTTAKLSETCGYVFQNPDHQIFKPTIWKEVTFGLKEKGFSKSEVKSKARKALKEVGLLGKKDTYPFNLGKGERQKLAVASILALEPEVLIIDEPCTGQDLEGIRYMMNLANRLNEKGKTIVMITHNMRIVARNADRVSVLRNGEVLMKGKTKGVFSKPEKLKKAFLKPPQVTRLAQSLEEYGVPNDILTVQEFYRYLKKRLKG